MREARFISTNPSNPAAPLDGGAGTEPSVGKPGREERVAELRLETVYPAEREAEVVAALREAHPYEEPAFDLYPLADPPAPA